MLTKSTLLPGIELSTFLDANNNIIYIELIDLGHVIETK